MAELPAALSQTLNLFGDSSLETRHGRRGYRRILVAHARRRWRDGGRRWSLASPPPPSQANETSVAKRRPPVCPPRVRQFVGFQAACASIEHGSAPRAA